MMINRIWGLVLSVIFRCACVIFSITKTQIHGTLVAVWKKGRILLVQKSYQKGWSVPGGLLRKSESREQAVARETFEEVGIRLNEEDLVFISEVKGELGPNNPTYLFEVQIDCPVNVRIDGREIVKAEFVLPEEALKRALNEHVAGYLRARSGFK